MPAADSSAPKMARVHYRDLWGMADAKRAALLTGTAGEYETFTPTLAQRFKLVPYESQGGYEDWAALDELFIEKYQGVQANRGREESLTDTDREALTLRMKDYYSTLPWAEFSRQYPTLAQDRAGYDARVVREYLNEVVGRGQATVRRSDFRESRVMPYVMFPLDNHLIYYETEGKLLNRRRPELWENLEGNEFYVTVPQPRQASESRPMLCTSLFDLHLHDWSSVGFPAFTTPKATATGTLFDEPAPPVPKANLAPEAWEALRAAYGLEGDLTGEAARSLVRRTFRAALALGHAPRFESDHRESLAQDWMHLPLPKDPALLDELAAAGDLVATLLDPLQTARPALREILGGDYARLAVVARPEGTTGPVDATVTYRYFGGGRGKWEATPAPLEGWREEWGDAAGDLYLNPSTYLTNVPERVWRYELGGYPVVKKWLGYRQAGRRDGKPLTPPELEHLRGIVHRLAALLALHARLDSLCERAIENAFTAEELGLRTVLKEATPTMTKGA